MGMRDPFGFSIRRPAKPCSMSVNPGMFSRIPAAGSEPWSRGAIVRRPLSWQTRSVKSVRAALKSPRLAPQWMAALLALGATVTVEGDAGPVEAPLEALLQRRVGGEVCALHVRVRGLKWSEARVARTPADEPIVAAVAMVEMDGGLVRQARVALTGVWPDPVRLAQAPAQLVGGPFDEGRIQVVAEAVEKEVAPKGDFQGSEEYRRAMAGVLTRRALAGCLRQEAGGE